MKEIKERIENVLSVLFNRDIASIVGISMTNDKEWTSLKHIEIVMAMEKEFEISFSASDIPKLTSTQSLIIKISEMLKIMQSE